MSDENREEIAEYVKGVAWAAYRHGFASGWAEHSSGPVPYDIALREADMYVAGDFDADIVKQFHPSARRSVSEGARDE